MSSLNKPKILKVDPFNPDAKDIEYCAKMIRLGQLVAFPTETVYGLAANMLDPRAVEKLYKVKDRPRSKPFTVLIPDIHTIADMGCALTGSVNALVSKFWPGPLTIILRSKTGENIGFRMPANKIALLLVKASGVPVVVPSANLSGSPAPTNAQDVLDQLFGRIELLIDGGQTEVGVESTVVDMTGSSPKILREGAISSQEILRTAGNE